MSPKEGPGAVALPSWSAFDTDHFAGRVVLVTGAASGMGREVALAFAALGARTALLDRDGGALEGVHREVPGSIPLVADVTDAEAVAAAYRVIDEECGRLDHLAHCAAVITASRTLDVDTAHWRRVLDINLVGSFLVAKEALRRMNQVKRGTIVLVASDAGFRGGGGLIADAPYAASKAGVLSLVKSLAREFADSGVRVNALVPGPTDTPMHGEVGADLKERIASQIPLGRMGHVADMAAAIVFLSSTAASFVYGTALDVDGGSMLR
ncbi:MAG: SDR family NAD(P)-dependent oxidoreductase [Carbonactinosporaceae bacterium]